MHQRRKLLLSIFTISKSQRNKNKQEKSLNKSWLVILSSNLKGGLKAFASAVYRFSNIFPSFLSMFLCKGYKILNRRTSNFVCNGRETYTIDSFYVKAILGTRNNLFYLEAIFINKTTVISGVFNCFST